MGNPFSRGRHQKPLRRTERSAVKLKQTHLSSQIDRLYQSSMITWTQKAWLKYYLKDLESLYRNYLRGSETKEEHFARIARIIHTEWRLTGNSDDTYEIVSKLSKYHRVRPSDTSVESVYHFASFLDRRTDMIPFVVVGPRDVRVLVRGSQEEIEFGTTVRAVNSPRNLSKLTSVSNEDEKEREEQHEEPTITATEDTDFENEMNITTMNTMEILGELECGQEVRVCHVSGRFAEIVQPIHGWIATMDEHGRILVERRGTIEDRAKYRPRSENVERKRAEDDVPDEQDFENPMTMSYTAADTGIAREASPIDDAVARAITDNADGLADGPMYNLPDRSHRETYSIHEYNPSLVKFDQIAAAHESVTDLNLPEDDVVPAPDPNPPARARSDSVPQSEAVVVFHERIGTNTSNGEGTGRITGVARRQTNDDDVDAEAGVGAGAGVPSSSSSGRSRPPQRLSGAQLRGARNEEDLIPEPQLASFTPIHTNDERPPPTTTAPNRVVTFEPSYKRTEDANNNNSWGDGGGGGLTGGQGQQPPPPSKIVFSQTGSSSISSYKSPSLYSLPDMDPVVGFHEDLPDGPKVTGAGGGSSVFLEQRVPDGNRTSPSPVPVMPPMGDDDDDEVELKSNAPPEDRPARPRSGSDDVGQPVLSMGDGDGVTGMTGAPTTIPHSRSAVDPLNPSSLVPRQEPVRVQSAPMSTFGGVSGEKYAELQGGDPVFGQRRRSRGSSGHQQQQQNNKRVRTASEDVRDPVVSDGSGTTPTRVPETLVVDDAHAVLSRMPSPAVEGRPQPLVSPYGAANPVIRIGSASSSMSVSSIVADPMDLTRPGAIVRIDIGALCDSDATISASVFLDEEFCFGEVIGTHEDHKDNKPVAMARVYAWPPGGAPISTVVEASSLHRLLFPLPSIGGDSRLDWGQGSQVQWWFEGSGQWYDSEVRVLVEDGQVRLNDELQLIGFPPAGVDLDIVRGSEVRRSLNLRSRACGHLDQLSH